MHTIDIVYLMIPFFFILLFFGERKYMASSFLIAASCVLNLIVDDPINQNFSGDEKERLFVLEINIAILWDSAIALILITSKFFNQASGKQASLLSFAVLCHIMLVYDLTVQSYFVTNLFYNWYVELIILVGMLQMAVAYNGFMGALSSLRKHIRWLLNNSGGSSTSLLELEEE